MAGRTNLELPDLARRDAVRAEAMATTPRYYSPVVHLAVPSLAGAAIIAVALAAVRGPSWLQLLTIPVTILLNNLAEWGLHKDLLHRRVKPLHVLYDRHTPMHHVIYITDDMALRDRREARLVLMPAFAILAGFAASLPIPAALVWLGHWNVAMLFAATTMFYLISYEWMHLAYHLPADSFIGRMRLVAFLRRHHALHHDPRLMRRWNFNVTIPIADLVLGTYLAKKRAATVLEKA